MSLSCNIVMDLTSLYKDSLASEETAAAIEAHLKECPACRRYYRRYDAIEQPAQSVAVIGEEEPFEESYRQLHKKIRRRRAFATAAVVASLCLSAAVVAVTLYELGEEEKTDPKECPFKKGFAALKKKALLLADCCGERR